VIVAVDASALVAMALGEPEADRFGEYLRSVSAAYIAPINITEAGLALVLRNGHFTRERFAIWLADQGVVEHDVAGGHALDVYLRLGRGVHRAGLNLGDCFAYALAKQLDAPLLFKGNDFIRTDIRPALQPT